MTNAKSERNMDGRDHHRNDGAYMRQKLEELTGEEIEVTA